MARDPTNPVEPAGGPRTDRRAVDAVVLDAPSAAVAREAVVEVCSRTRLTEEAIEDFVLGGSEVVTNALRHGAPPVRVVILARPDRVEVAVGDAGPGPDDLDVAAARGVVCPVPADAERGRGLWLAFRSCDEVEVTADGAGCTVRLVAYTNA